MLVDEQMIKMQTPPTSTTSLDLRWRFLVPDPGEDAISMAGGLACLVSGRSQERRGRDPQTLWRGVRWHMGAGRHPDSERHAFRVTSVATPSRASYLTGAPSRYASYLTQQRDQEEAYQQLNCVKRC